MRTLRVIVAACALLLLLGAPALLFAAETDPPDPATPADGAPPADPLVPADPAAAADVLTTQPPLQPANQPPAASFRVEPDSDPAESSVAVGQGETVTLDASGSSDAEGALARFEWDLDGDGLFESDAGPGAVLTHAFATPGTFAVRVRVTDTGGATAEEKKTITVAAPAEPDAAPAGDPAAPAGAPKAGASAAKRRSAEDGDREPTARTAASASVSIVDFSFRPGTVTVNVGDTVTWTNNGDQPHTATARDGSFDTGNLRSGRSGSHTFNRAGSFAYICTPHPFMRGTVVVRGAGGGGGGGDDAGAAGSDSGGGGTGSDSGGGAAGDDGSSGGLAQTGSNVALLIALGMLMLLMGAALNRRLPDTRP